MQLATTTRAPRCTLPRLHQCLRRHGTRQAALIPINRLGSGSLCSLTLRHPHHKSMLTELVASHAAMPVAEATDGVRVEPNRLYVIPPNATMTLRTGPCGCRIDLGLREGQPAMLLLDRSHAQRAVATGSGQYDAQGVFGLIVSQRLEERIPGRRYSRGGMPQSAAATGSVTSCFQKHLQLLGGGDQEHCQHGHFENVLVKGWPAGVGDGKGVLVRSRSSR